MDGKLTLSIRPEVIADAKEWARREGKSLSALVEDFLEKSAGKNSALQELRKLVKGAPELTDEDALKVFRDFSGSIPKLTDEEVTQHIHQHRMTKYGGGI